MLSSKWAQTRQHRRMVAWPWLNGGARSWNDQWCRELSLCPLCLYSPGSGLPKSSKGCAKLEQRWPNGGWPASRRTRERAARLCWRFYANLARSDNVSGPRQARRRSDVVEVPLSDRGMAGVERIRRVTVLWVGFSGTRERQSKEEREINFFVDFFAKHLCVFSFYY